ncbi:MAG: translation initiation factor eIF-2B [Armatimonadota bacterium]|nr:translation initiation factor eIF-2B [Armatimonadota bacterium]MDR7402720.1 translation initiation factor eIF-2B [Armatimonadota bacterium]MDR7403505.1 translation initiation factor eIF-2B [Armatimonadota bacterium]MDR7506484.1 translation initiation factor eIF-2B [Armatimonadota bacterium]MDR7509849.1 translation initiation factor eIF-2B [Armatimonadota bacterium]
MSSTGFSELLRQLRAGEVSGGSAIGRAAAQVLALSVAEYTGSDYDEMRRRLRDTARELLLLMPVMATVANAVRAAEGLLEAKIASHAPAEEIRAALSAWAHDTVRRSEVNLERLAEAGAHLLADGVTLVTHSRSDSVIRILRAACRQRKTLTIIATESRPLREGRRVLEEAARLGFRGELIPDAAVGARIREAHLALVGADAILPSGAFLNKTGTFLLALAARHFGIPLYVAAETAKLDLRAVQGHPPDVGSRPPEELTEGWVPPDGITVWNRFFEVTPAPLVEAYITERGVVPAGGIGLWAQRLLESHPAEGVRW